MTDAALTRIFDAALRGADPSRLVAAEAGKLRLLYREGGYSRLLAIAFGKAAVPMAATLQEALGDMIIEGIALTKYGHASQTLGSISVREAGHPIPDRNGVAATDDIIALAKGADAGTLAVILISGGGSALLVSPCDGITLEEKREVTSLLLKAGADIDELNRVRKHLSKIKGGRLAELLSPATTVSLILSDVIGDPPHIIASGPTAPDPSTFSQAADVLTKYDITAPTAVLDLLRRGKEGLLPETPKPGAVAFQQVDNRIIGSNGLALAAAGKEAALLGFKVRILSEPVVGEAREAGRALADRALAVKNDPNRQGPLCLISGGETTVTVTGRGIGGRNMELALAFALAIEGIPGITLLSAGTDGTDGPTDAAGAIVDGHTVASGKAKGINGLHFLADNNSYSFFREAGGLVTTGPTGTNVMDLQLILIS